MKTSFRHYRLKIYMKFKMLVTAKYIGSRLACSGPKIARIVIGLFCSFLRFLRFLRFSKKFTAYYSQHFSVLLIYSKATAFRVLSFRNIFSVWFLSYICLGTLYLSNHSSFYKKLALNFTQFS